MTPLLSSESFIKGVPDIVVVLFKSCFFYPSLKKQCKEKLSNMSTQHWDKHLQMLQVQRKFADIVTLEKENQTWKTVMRKGLTSGQLSFLDPTLFQPQWIYIVCIFSIAHHVPCIVPTGSMAISLNFRADTLWDMILYCGSYILSFCLYFFILSHSMLT